MVKPPKINRVIRLLIKKTIADYLNNYIHKHNDITVASINKISENLSYKACEKIHINYDKFYYYEECCNNCFYGQFPPTCGKTYGELCDNGWCEFYLRWKYNE